jgi:hypothetical protein
MNMTKTITWKLCIKEQLSFMIPFHMQAIKYLEKLLISRIMQDKKNKKEFMAYLTIEKDK